MYKKGILVLVLGCVLSMTGCIVINTGKDDGETKETVKEVVVQPSTTNSANSNSNNSSTTTTSNTSRAYQVSGYIFYDSDTSYLTNSDLQGLSSWELKLARNEIFARRGRLFSDSSLQDYFDSCSWYYGYILPEDFNDDSLNKVEQYNVKLIKEYE